MESFKTFFRMSLIPYLNRYYKLLINLLEVNLKTQLEMSIPEEKQENHTGKSYTKHYLWQSNFLLYYENKLQGKLIIIITTLLSDW